LPEISDVEPGDDRDRSARFAGASRPPGAVEESVFLSRCITCDACVSVCPQNALHPCTIGADRVINWNTPKLVPRIGYCEEECTRCSEACPTGALLPIKVEEKEERKIGTAYVERGICRSWRMQYKCIICARKCPYEAIDRVTIENENGREFEVPIVNKRKCNGCGICEYKCPLKSESAIKVSSYGEKRIKVIFKESRLLKEIEKRLLGR
jgi:MauM/NapG family ferredoxin protein